MKYKLIIQELKKSTDQNVRAFVNDVEGMKRLTTEQRKNYLANLQKTESISLLVKDFIPYIITHSLLYSPNNSQEQQPKY